MERNQKINCTVASCQHNNTQKQECKLEQIIVTPTANMSSQAPDESQCSSYQNDSNTEVTKKYQR